MPYNPTKFSTIAALNASIIERVYQNTINAVDGDVHQQVELDEAVSLWREPTAVLPLAYSGLLQSQQIKLTDGTAIGVTLQWNGTEWVEAQVRTGKTLWVDAAYGDPANAQPYNPFRPYLNLDAAQTAATTGDIIYVRPGAYTTSGIGKDGVNWYFDAGCAVSGPIKDGGVTMAFSIMGQASFTHSADTLAITAANSNVVVTAKKIESTGVASYAIRCTGGYALNPATLKVDADLNSTFQGIYCQGFSRVTLRGDITATTGVDFNSAGSVTMIGNIIATTAGINSASGTMVITGNISAPTGIQFQNNPDITMNGNISSSVKGIVSASGKLTLRGRITAPVAIQAGSTGYVRVTDTVSGTIQVSSSATVEVGLKTSNPVTLASGATLVLAGGARVLSAGATYCVTGPVGSQVISYGGYGDKAIDPNVTVLGSYTVGAYVQ